MFKHAIFALLGATLTATASYAGSVSVTPPQVVIRPPGFVPTPVPTPTPAPAPAPAPSGGNAGQTFVPTAPDLSQILPSGDASGTPGAPGSTTGPNTPTILTQVTPQSVASFPISSLSPGQAQIAFDAITNILDSGAPLPPALQSAFEAQQTQLAQTIAAN